MAYRVLETIASDPLDLNQHGGSSVPAHSNIFVGTATHSRMDGHERVYDQVLHQAYDLGASATAYEFHRLFTTYRADGVATSVTRAETTTGSVTDRSPVSGHTLTRTFDYDSIGRRLSSTDPDADARSGSATVRHWRYLFSRTGDLVAVRDPRGCGQNFYYDWAGRLLAEDYVACGEAQASGQNGEPLPAHAMGLEPLASPTTQNVDVSYLFDAEPAWDGMDAAPAGTHLRGRLTGTSDRGQRSAVDYDARGRLVWSARQMALIPSAASVDATLSGNAPAVDDDDAPTGGSRLYDEVHVYATSVVYDRLDRVVSRTYPEDPEASGVGPVVGSITYDRRGLPHATHLVVGTSVDEPILREALYDQQRRNYENHFGRSALALVRSETYDVRHRPLTTTWTRAATPGATLGELGAVTTISDLHYAWNAASNLLELDDQSDAEQWPATQKPRRQTVEHDALYRVVGIEHDYRQDDDTYDANGQPYQDWRAEQAYQNSADPMTRQPAPRLGDAPDERVVSFTYRYDWLANQVEHTDDSGAFYERMLGAEGQVVNGFGATEASADARPTSLYLSSNLPTAGAMSPDVNVDRGGWLRVHYGASGNVVAMTVRARCHDLSGATACYDDATETDVDDRATHLLAVCVCEDEQHYQYRWDELNRLHEARRYDRNGGSGTWSLEVRQRYRYDGANVRTVKETIDDSMVPERIALYVMAGDYERRGLVKDSMNDTYEPSSGVTEAQYLVSGARVVWKNSSSSPISTGTFDSELRVTMALPNLIQSTSAVVDLASGELTESVTFHPNGVRETLVSNRQVEAFALEPVGFTGKEDDAEVGLVYFGERYLMPHLGRWASTDPLQTHGGGGGEFGNSYHYVSGNVLQTRDPLGLCGEPGQAPCQEARARTAGSSSVREAMIAQRNAESPGYTISVRIDLPGQPQSSAQHRDAPRIVVRGDTSTGLEDEQGHAMIVFSAPGQEDIVVGWYPREAARSIGEFRSGVEGVLRDDSGHGYDFEAKFRVSPEEFQRAANFVLAHEGNWGSGEMCTDFAVEVLASADITIPNETATMEALGERADEVFPGILARSVRKAARAQTAGDGAHARGATSQYTNVPETAESPIFTQEQRDRLGTAAAAATQSGQQTPAPQD
ncbi:MAG: RHS repeat-associated core domain-containing protein [Polyangiales bacterium]